MTVTFVETDEFNIKGEFLWFGVVLHSDVYVRWSKGVLKRFRSELQRVLRIINVPAFAFQTPTHDPKKRKFIQATGGTFHHYRLTPDGEQAEMYLFRPLDLSKGDNNGRTI